jgi:23S rRNA pseudouridine1911/1915/1917 synthase
MPIPEIAQEGKYSLGGNGSRASASLEATAKTRLPIELTVDDGVLGERLDKWLAARMNAYSRSRLQQWISSGAVRVNGEVAEVRHPVWSGDQVSVIPRASAEETAFQSEALTLDVVHEDAAIIVLNKSAGVVVHPAAGNWSGTLLNGLLHHSPQLAGVPRAGIVHRLDKDTSGLMVVAKTIEAQTDLVRQLQARTVRREYLAVVYGTPPDAGEVDAAIARHPRDRLRMAAFPAGAAAAHRGAKPISVAAAKPALTSFRVLQRFAPAPQGDARTEVALVLCRLATGRTHQIRVHMQSRGFPLVGDPVYGEPGRGKVHFGRQALHAWRLGLIHPESGREHAWTAQPPDDFLDLLDTLGLPKKALAALLKKIGAR